MAERPRKAPRPNQPLPQPTAARHVGSRRRRIAVRLGAAGVGLAAGFSLLGWLWPEADRSLEAPKNLTAADLAKAPNRSITVLVIGVDGDRLGDASNGAAPPGPANNDALVLVRVNPQGPLQVLTVPTNLAVKLPGQKSLQPLGALYRLGGPALTADAVRELVGLGPEQPERYLVVSRAGLRQLVDELGGVNANPPMEMRYSDKRQNLVINLDGGLQKLNGRQIEQLARFQDPLRPDDSRQDNAQEVARSLLKELATPEQLGRIPSLVRAVKSQLGTNLSEAESLSLLAAALANPDGVQFSSFPLAPPSLAPPSLAPGSPASGQKGQLSRLRQRAKDGPSPLWPSP